MGMLLPKNEIDTSRAGKMMGCSPRRIRQLCAENFFKTAFKPTGRRGNWHLSRLEVLEKRLVTSLESKYNPE